MDDNAFLRTNEILEERDDPLGFRSRVFEDYQERGNKEGLT